MKNLNTLDGIDIGDVNRDLDKKNSLEELKALEEEEKENMLNGMDQLHDDKNAQPQDQPSPVKEADSPKKKAAPVKQRQKKKQPPPSLRKLLKILEAANGDNNNPMKHLKTLSADVDYLIL